jgi:hypothetical protein
VGQPRKVGPQQGLPARSARPQRLSKQKQNNTKQNKTKQNKTKQNKTKQNKTKQRAQSTNPKINIKMRW